MYGKLIKWKKNAQTFPMSLQNTNSDYSDFTRINLNNMKHTERLAWSKKWKQSRKTMRWTDFNLLKLLKYIEIKSFLQNTLIWIFHRKCFWVRTDAEKNACSDKMDRATFQLYWTVKQLRHCVYCTSQRPYIQNFAFISLYQNNFSWKLQL